MAESKRVAALDADGNFGTVDEADAEAMERSGGRILTRQEVAAKEAADAYAAAPLSQKIAGAVAQPFETGVLAATPGLGPVALAGGALAAGLRSTGAQALPEQEALGQGIDAAMTGGMSRAAIHEAVRAVGGEKAAKAYAETTARAGEAHDDWKTAGTMAGVGATLVGGGFGDVAGQVTQNVAGRALSGLATRGVAGRALATAGELGARGAVEGALMAGAQQLSEDMLGDREVTADKLFAAMGTGALYGGAGGALLGGAGSLAGSGLKAAGGAARSSLSRVLSNGAEALSDAGVKSELRGAAHKEAWKALGAGFGLQSTRYAKQAAKYLPEGEKSVGEVLMRKGILNPDEGFLAAVKGATPEAMAPKIAGELETVGQRIGDITNASGATITRTDIDKAFQPVLESYGKIAGREGEVAAVEAYKASLLGKLGLEAEGRAAAVQDVLAQRKGLDGIIYAEQKTLDPKGRLAALRDIRGQVEDLILAKMDDASGRVPGELAAEYKALKKDYLALSIAKEAAEDSAARMAKGATLGLGEKFAVGSALASGNLLAAPVLGVGGKMLRERGNAAAAVMLNKLADMQSLTRMVAKMDDTITRASRGVLEPPKALAKGAHYREPARVHADRVAKQVIEAQANPQRFVSRIQQVTASMNVTAPGLAGSLSKRMTDAVAFLATKLPKQPDPDPFDPHPPVRMTPVQAMEFSRYASYVEQPKRFFEEAERGQITFEGVEVAKALMPDAFAEMQARTAEGLAELLARGVRVPIRQRERLGLLMDFPAVPSQRPEHIAFLQANVVGSEQASQAPGPASQGPKRPIQTRPQQTTFDRLEET